jgi:hypothetical protein
LAGGIAYLSKQNQLQRYEIAGTTVLVAILCMLAFILMLGLRRPTQLRRLLRLVQKGINRFAKKAHRDPVLPDDWRPEMGQTFPMRLKPSKLIRKGFRLPWEWP